jgi:hypothetical protein
MSNLVLPNIAEANADQRQWIAQEVAAEDTGYGGWYYQSRLDDG